MSRRRRRWIRDEVVAPWLTMAVILGLWWLAASMLASRRDAAAPVPERADAAALVARDAGRADSVDLGNDVVASIRDGAPPTGAMLAGTEPAANAETHDESWERRLLVPVAGVDHSALNPSFDEARGSGRRHEAIDILAPRGTEVRAALDGRIVKLFTSAAGGLTIYQFDPDEAHCFYYAHLDAYVPDLADGQWVVRGQTIGYVGTTGNAPAGTPHLHFAIFKLGPEKLWWEGTAIDPFPVLRGSN